MKLLTAIPALLALACSEGSAGTPEPDPIPTSTPDGAAPTAPDATDAPERSSFGLPNVCDFLAAMDEEPRAAPETGLYGRTVELVGGAGGAPCAGIAGVRVCLYNSDFCATSDADGFYALEGVPQGETEITFVKDGFFPTLRQVVSSGSGRMRLYGPTMFPATTYDTDHSNLGLERDPARGGLEAHPVSGGGSPAPDGTPLAATVTFAAGLQMRLSPESGDGPIYYSGSDDPRRRFALDPELTVTDGMTGGRWFNVEPGDYTLEFLDNGEPAPCSSMPHAGFGLDEQGRLKVRIRAGLHNNFVGGVCALPPM
jgi:hypothetical protein